MTYPILVTRLQDPYNPIGDVYRGNYQQGATVAEDRLDGFEPVSNYPTADENGPTWSPAGAPVLRMDALLIEKKPGELGTVWTRDDADDFALTPQALYYTSKGALYRLPRPGGRAQRVEVPAPLAGGLEATEEGLVLQTDRGLIRYDPESGQGQEIALGNFEDFSLSQGKVVYSSEGSLRIRDLATQQDQLLLPSNGEYRNGPRFSPDQSRVFFVSWHIAPDLSCRSRLQVLENRLGAVPRTLAEQVIEVCPQSGIKPISSHEAVPATARCRSSSRPPSPCASPLRGAPCEPRRTVVRAGA